MKTKIPDDIKEQISKDSYFRGCALCGKTPVQIHHHLIHGGCQINELWSLFPLCRECHAIADRKDIRSKLNVLMRERAGKALEKYEKVKKFI